MDEKLRWAMRTVLFFMSAALLVWAVLPDWRTEAAGLIVGGTASALNALLLRRRIAMIGEFSAKGQSRRLGSGYASRLAVVLFAIMLAYRFPDKLSLIATLIGCFLVQVFLWISILIPSKGETTRKG